MIETRLLQYFLAVAEEQNITRAAEYLHITQPTLSKQMMELEERLGKPLLVRGKKKITLTEEGVYLRARAQEILSLMETTEAALHQSGQSISGDVFIGCGEYRSALGIMEMLRRIREEYPGVCVHFFSGNADAITERLDKGLLDAGILLEPEIDDKYDYQKLDLTERWGVYMRRDAPLAAQETVRFEDLAGLPLIMPSQSSNSRLLGAAFANAVGKPQVAASYTLVYNAALMVEAGVGYAVCIGGLINTAGEHPLTFRPLSPELSSGLYLFTKKYQTFSKAAKLILSRLREEFT